MRAPPTASPPRSPRDRRARTIAVATLAALSTLGSSLVASGATPAPPPVDDPLLAPAPRAANEVATWREALAIVRDRSTDLRIALDQVTRAEALSRQALAGLLPTLNATGNVTQNLLRQDQQISVPTGFTTTPPAITYATTTVTVPDAQTYGASLSLTQPVIAPRAWHALGTAERQRDVARLSVDDQKRQIVGAVANAIVGVVTAERVAEIDRVGLRAALERQALTERRQVLGSANALDVVRARQDAEVTRASVISADESLAQAREALGLALGHPGPWGVPPDIRLDALEASAHEACAEGGKLDDRADLAALHANVDVASRNVDDVWLQFSPTVNLVSTLSLSSVQLSNTRHEAWSIGGVLSVPLWDGGYRYGALHDARAQADQASQRLLAARRAAEVQVEQARRAVRVAEQSRAVSQRARDLAAETDRLSRVSYEAGSATSLDLIDAGRRLREGESQLALRELELVRVRITSLLALARCNY